MKNTIVLNEVEFVERALSEQRILYSARDTISRLAKYYCQVNEVAPSEAKTLLNQFIDEAIPASGRETWKRAAAFYVDNPNRYPLSAIDFIVVTDHELSTIRQLDSTLKERLMTTLLVLAKYYNAIRTDNDNHVFTDFPSLFKLANIRHSEKVRMKLLGDLSDQGLISCEQRLSNNVLQINIVDDTGEPALKICDMRNIGFQYNALSQSGYVVCEDCGLVIKKKSNSHKFCSDCATYRKMNSALNRYSQQLAAI